MGRESKKRHITWFTKPRLKTVGQVWQQPPQSEQFTDDRLTGDWPAPEIPGMPEMPEMPGSAASHPSGRQRWPSLPLWPPLSRNAPVAPKRQDDETPDISDSVTLDNIPVDYSSSDQIPRTEWMPGPGRGQQYPGVPDLPYEPPRTVWQRFQAAPRRLRIGLIAAIVGVLVVCPLLSVVVLGNIFGTHPSTLGNGLPGGGLTSGQSGLSTPTNPLSTPSPDTSPTATLATETVTPVPPFTIAFTCASGAVGGTGQVCIHTQPDAVVSLAVRYCDGNYATGKGLRGTAHADGNGDYTWRWNVTTHCVGTATATVTVKASGQTLTQSTTFDITR